MPAPGLGVGSLTPFGMRKRGRLHSQSRPLTPSPAHAFTRSRPTAASPDPPGSPRRGSRAAAARACGRRSSPHRVAAGLHEGLLRAAAAPAAEARRPALSHGVADLAARRRPRSAPSRLARLGVRLARAVRRGGRARGLPPRRRRSLSPSFSAFTTPSIVSRSPPAAIIESATACEDADVLHAVAPLGGGELLRRDAARAGSSTPAAAPREAGPLQRLHRVAPRVQHHDGRPRAARPLPPSARRGRVRGSRRALAAPSRRSPRRRGRSRPRRGGAPVNSPPTNGSPYWSAGFGSKSTGSAAVKRRVCCSGAMSAIQMLRPCVPAISSRSRGWIFRSCTGTVGRPVMKRVQLAPRSSEA